MSRRKSPSATETWTPKEVKDLYIKDAKRKLSEEKQKEAEHKVVYVPHPTIRNTMIRKIIN
jgi:hypothetical protein